MTVSELKWIIEVLPDDAEVRMQHCGIDHHECTVATAEFKDRDVNYRNGRLILYNVIDPD